MHEQNRLDWINVNLQDPIILWTVFYLPILAGDGRYNRSKRDRVGSAQMAARKLLSLSQNSSACLRSMGSVLLSHDLSFFSLFFAFANSFAQMIICSKGVLANGHRSASPMRAMTWAGVCLCNFQAEVLAGREALARIVAPLWLTNRSLRLLR